nr:MAG TPA: Protein of unknown function (DUF2842) [Caudoviricetes sp.]
MVAQVLPPRPLIRWMGRTVGKVVSLTENRKMRFLDLKNEKN